ncbi:MAG: prepilin peptidase [Nitrososphaerales archaeon]
MNLDVISLNIGIASVTLLLTSYLDLKKREVEDKVWIVFGAVGVVLEIYEVLNGVTSVVNLLIAILLAAVVGLGIFFFGLYGGADAKALIVIAILVPYFRPNMGIYAIAPLMVLTNGVLLSMSLPLGLLILNTTRLIRGQKIFEGFEETFARKLFACFLGYKSNGSPRDFQFSMEKKQEPAGGSETLGKKFDFSFIQDEFESQPLTWVTPGIPLLVFFTIGFFVLLLYGDLVIGLVAFFAGLL